MAAASRGCAAANDGSGTEPEGEQRGPQHWLGNGDILSERCANSKRTNTSRHCILTNSSRGFAPGKGILKASTLRAELESIVGLSVVPFDSWYVPPALSSDETVRGPACPLWADRFGALTPPHSGRVTRYPERASGAFNALSEQLRTAGVCRHW